jgi:hypothetical protein
MGIKSRRNRRQQQKPVAGTDMEQAFLEAADEPLRKLEHQTLSFTFMWRQALQRLSLLLVFYAAFATYRSLDEPLIVQIAHVVSGTLYTSCSKYISADMLKMSHTSHPWFFMSVLQSLFLVGTFAYALFEESGLTDVTRKLVPVASFYHMLVCGSLLYMASMGDKVIDARMALKEIDRSK